MPKIKQLKHECDRALVYVKIDKSMHTGRGYI